MKHRKPQFWYVLYVVLICWMAPTFLANAKALSAKTEANVMVELAFTAHQTYADPFNDVTLDVVFVDLRGRELRVPAFWDGTNIWKARYASPIVGAHRFHSECSNTRDTGLHHISGKVEVKPYTGKNPLYIHGPIKVASNKRYMTYTDGTPFFWLGDTWWMGLCHRLHFPEEFAKLTADRKEKGFNVIQIVAGLYPDMFPFDPRGANEAGYPWQTNYTAIRPEYFDAADKRIEYLVNHGFSPCIVGAWGYFMPWMDVEKAKQHWRNLVARYGALPVVWCVAGEANLPWYLAKGFPYDDRQQVKDWTEVAHYLRDVDPFHRLITIHPTGIGRLSARAVMDDVSLLDIDMLQTPHGQRDAVAPTINTVRHSYADNPVMPVIDGEASYEMLGDNLPTQWTRRMFWICLMNGTAGHTYGANGIWQLNRKGQPHGPSPHHHGGDGYGKIPWDEAMNLPGSRQVGLGKKFLEQFQWQNFRPHPEWASFESQSTLSFDGCNWIWFPEGNPTQNAPAEKRFFRRTFVLPDSKTIKSAQLRVSADDQFSARLNGELVGASNGAAETWRTGRQFDNVARLLKDGTNVVGIMAENMPANGANPAGLIVRFEIRFNDGSTSNIVSDSTWHSAKNETVGWDKLNFDDNGWQPALAIGKHGDSPWGRLDPLQNDAIFGPQAAGISGVVRVIYVPEGEPVIAKSLGREAEYVASNFDPVTGSSTTLPDVKADDAGSWECPPPKGVDHDWVLVLKTKRTGRASTKHSD